MATGAGYFEFIKEQLSSLNGVSYTRMMGEYIIRCNDRVVGGIYDDRLLVKPTASAKRMMPDAHTELPYDGAKEMLAVDNVDDREFLCRLIEAVAEELPPRKPR